MSVGQTLRNVVLPFVTDDHARSAVVQLVGLALYAVERGADPTESRVEEIASALDELRGNRFADAHWPPGSPRDGESVMRAASDVLSTCVGLPDDDAEVVAVRSTLRPVLMAHLDADLASNGVLMGTFRGKLPDA